MAKTKVRAHTRKGKTKVRQHDRETGPEAKPGIGKEMQAKKASPDALGGHPSGMVNQMAKEAMYDFAGLHPDADPNNPATCAACTEHVHAHLKGNLDQKEFKHLVGSKRKVQKHVLVNYGGVWDNKKTWGG